MLWKLPRSGWTGIPDMMTVRRSTVEHPFGTLKFWMGHTHFLMKTLDNAGTEMSLHVLAYNMKRVMKILGVPELLQAMQAWRIICSLLARFGMCGELKRSRLPSEPFPRDFCLHREIRAGAAAAVAVA